MSDASELRYVLEEVMASVPPEIKQVVSEIVYKVVAITLEAFAKCVQEADVQVAPEVALVGAEAMRSKIVSFALEMAKKYHSF